MLALSAAGVFAQSHQSGLTHLEKTFHCKIGVYAIDTGTHQVISYHANDRFPVQSTFKLLAVAAILKKSMLIPGLLQQNIHYKQRDITSWSPVTKLHITTGMTITQLCAAAMSYSDNTAVNLLIKKLGGPRSVTKFAKLIGNQSFNLQHYEANLNSNPKILVDTSTPKDMAHSLQKLLLGNVLAKNQRLLLLSWMKDNTTGYQRIRSGMPPGWVVADKTGTGRYGVANDVAILWSPEHKPIVLTIYTYSGQEAAKPNSKAISAVTQQILTH